MTDTLVERLRLRLLRLVQMVRTALAILARQGPLALFRALIAWLRPPPPPAPLVPPPERYGLPEERPLAFFPAGRPRLSVIVETEGQDRLTRACLQALQAQLPAEGSEIIVVDAAAGRRPADFPAGVPGVELIAAGGDPDVGRQRALGAARGELLLYLRAAVMVLPGAVATLLSRFEGESRAGVASPQIVGDDGLVLYAGGALGGAGGADPARGEDPRRPELGWCRPARLPSLACVLVRAALRGSLAAALADKTPAGALLLARRARELGLEVEYQGASRVVYFREADSFRRDWPVARAAPADADADEAGAGVAPAAPRPRAIVVDATTLTTDQDAGSLRMLAILRLLQERGYCVTFIPNDLSYIERYTRPLQAMGIEVPFAPYVTSARAYLAERLPGAALVVLSRVLVADCHLDLVREVEPRATVIFDTVDLHYLREQRLAELRDDDTLRQAAAERRRMELSVANRADITLVVSPAEVEVLRRDAPRARVEILSTIHDAQTAGPGHAAREGLLFIGGFNHPPNRDAMTWFVGEVLPLLRTRRPGLRLTIVGSNPTPEVRALAGEDVEVLGYVPDLAPLLARCRLTVAPLRYGAGVKGKVNASMGHGVPVVATPIAVEGMHLEHGKNVLVAESAAEFAEAVARLHDDAALWDRLSLAGRENIREHFSTTAARRALERILGGQGDPRPA